MKKKEVKKGSLFNTESVKKTTLKGEIIRGVLVATIFTAISYLILVHYNYEARLILRAINEEQITAFESTAWIFCLFLIISLTIKIGVFTISYSKKK